MASGFFLNLIVSIALRFGMAWLIQKFPWLPPEVRQIIDELIQKIHVNKQDKVMLIKEAKTKIRNHCSGIGCAPDLVD